jgi:hypothetical protein
MFVVFIDVWWFSGLLFRVVYWLYIEVSEEHITSMFRARFRRDRKLMFYVGFGEVLEMGRYMPVYRTGTSFLFLNFIPVPISIHYIHVFFSVFDVIALFGF